MAMKDFFATSAGINRELFVEAYGDIAKISQMMIAPLGVGFQANSANVLGVEKAEEECMKLFRKWEEVVSRSVYASKNIPEDRVAASMHLFLEIRKDHVVLDSIRREAANVNAMISPPSVLSMVEAIKLTSSEVENYHNLRKSYGISGEEHKEVSDKDAWVLGDFDASSRELNLNTPGVAAYLMKRVLMAIRTMYDCFDEASLPSSWAQKYGSKSAGDVSVREYAFSPHDILLLRVRDEVGQALKTSLASTNSNKKGDKFGMPASAIDALVSCLSVPRPDTGQGAVSVTVLQYFALLDTFGESPVVERALETCFKMETGPEDVAEGGLRLSALDTVRVGGRKHLLASPFTEAGGDLSTTLAFSAPYSPITSFLTQLSCTTREGDDEQQQEDEDESSSVSAERRVVVASENLIAAQHKAEQSASSVEAGMLLSKALKDASRTVEGTKSEDEDEDVEKEEKSGDEMGEEEEEMVLLSLAGAVPDPLLASVLSAWASSITSNYTNTLQEAMTYGSPMPAGESEDPAESPSLRRALRLAELAIEMRSFDGRGYEARAGVKSLLGQRELEEVELELLYGDGGGADDEAGSGAIAARGSEHLHSAAKDALAAFHLGGSSDLSLAGNAEDACRQASRLAAKMHYREKMNKVRARAEEVPFSGSNGSDLVLGSSANDNELDMPRLWFVQAYLCGYEPPSLALSVPVLARGGIDGEPIDCGYLSLRDVEAPHKRKSGEMHGEYSHLNDIDHDENTRGNEDPHAQLLPMPPRSFLMAPDGQGEGEGGVDGGTSKGYVGRELDRQAFRLLQHLVTLLEASMLSDLTGGKETDSGAPHGDSLGAGAGAGKGMERFVKGTSLLGPEQGSQVKVLVTRQAESCPSFLADLPGSDAELLAHGICSTTENQGPAEKEEGKGEGSEDEEGEAFAANFEEQESSDGEGAAEAGADAADEPRSYVCSNFREVARILHSEDACRLTGVSFHPSTHLVEAVAGPEAMQGVSVPIRARLLNLCSVAAYLLGDAEGAVTCLRASLDATPLRQDVTELGSEAGSSGGGSIDPCGLIDSAIKLGALLCDMDERKEASEVLSKAHAAAEVASMIEARERSDGDDESEDEDGYHYHHGDLLMPARGQTGYIGCQAVSMLHLAELAIHRMELDEAQNILQKANRLVVRVTRDGPDSLDDRVWARFSSQLDTNVTSLLGVVLFRKSPEEPDDALRLLKRACKQAPDSLYLHLSYGEVLGQAGDLVGSLACFHQAHESDPTHPLPFVNAARTYQQLNQTSTARRHLDRALLLDPSFSLTYIDVAQGALQGGRTEEALQILDKALLLARHVSDLLDVLTARRVAELQLCLEGEGLYHPPAPA